MKVEVYYRRNWKTKRPLGPPFICPWANEGCDWISQDQKKHQEHIRSVHELPALEERWNLNKKEKIAQ